MALTKVTIVLAVVLAIARAAPAPQQVLSQPGGTILIPISRFSQTQIQGVPYIILPAGAGATQSFAPGRFFLRSAVPSNAIAPPQIQTTQNLVPVPVQQSTADEVQQSAFVRIAQPAPASAPAPAAPAPAPAPVQPVLVRQEIVKPGQKVAVFRKPLDVNKGDQSQGSLRPPQPYSFSYSINGENTGDVKSASETSDGEIITGSYSLIEPDGTLRVVKYQAHPKNGFTAQVERTAGAFPAIPDPPRHVERVQAN